MSALQTESQSPLKAFTPSPLPRLRVCNPGGGDLRRRVPVPRCRREEPSHPKVPLLLCALPALGLRTGHAAGPASFLRCGSGLHRAVSWLRGHHHGDGRCGVSQLPVSGIYPQRLVLLRSPVHVLGTSKCLCSSSLKCNISNTEADKGCSMPLIP